MVGILLRSSAWSAVLLPGLLLLFSALLVPASPGADRKQRHKLERELAVYATSPSGAIWKQLLTGIQTESHTNYVTSSPVRPWPPVTTRFRAPDGAETTRSPPVAPYPLNCG